MVSQYDSSPDIMFRAWIAENVIIFVLIRFTELPIVALPRA